MNLLPIGTRIRSKRVDKIVGTIQGYGVLNAPSTALSYYGIPHVVYLVWRDGSPGSNSLTDPTVHVLDVHQVELI